MSNQSNEHKSVNDSELEAAAGGVIADGQDKGKNFSVSGHDRKTIGQIVVDGGENINIGGFGG